MNWSCQSSLHQSIEFFLAVVKKFSTPYVPGKFILFKPMIIAPLIRGASCWYANIDCLKSLEKIQKLSLKWACLDQNSTYEKFLSELDFLPLSLYICNYRMSLLFYCVWWIAMNIVLFDNFVWGTELATPDHLVMSDLTTTNFENSSVRGTSSNAQMLNWLLATIDITNPTGLKKSLLPALWSFFTHKYKDVNRAKWKM